MSPAEIVTLIGVLAATTQLILAHINYWEFRQELNLLQLQNNQQLVIKLIQSLN